MATQTLFNNLPSEAFSITAGPGNIFSGGAVAFRPQQNGSVAAVSLLLSGYTGANGQEIRVELYDNQVIGAENKPSLLLGTFTVPAGNDGLAAEFICTLSASVSLATDQIYWLLAYGTFTMPPSTGSAASWLAGAANPQVVQTAQFIVGNYQLSTAVPAFKVLSPSPLIPPSNLHV